MKTGHVRFADSDEEAPAEAIQVRTFTSERFSGSWA